MTLLTQDNANLLQHLKSGFKITINWKKNNNITKKLTERPNKYLDYLIHPSFPRVHRPFVLSFEDEAQQAGFKRYYLLTIEIQKYNVMIDGQNIFWLTSKKKFKNMTVFEKLQQVKEMGTQLVVC